jgi:hypothetical protein
VRVPWAEPGSRFTLHFEAFAVAVIAACRSLSVLPVFVWVRAEKRLREEGL